MTENNIMSHLVVGNQIYSAHGSPCIIKRIIGDRIEATERAETKISRDNGRISETQIHEYFRTFNISDFGSKFFISVSDYQEYIEKSTPAPESRPPMAEKLTEKLYDEILNSYIDTKRSISEEQTFYKITQLHTSEEQPYFGRIDFCTEYRKDEYYDKIYVGRRNIFSDGQILVYDWRNPVAGFYNRDLEYKWTLERDGHTYNYSALLRRRFEYPRPQEIRFENTYLIGGSPYDGITDIFLQKILRQKAFDKSTTDIIRTIQSEQDQIIRSPLDGNLIVQGCAGSGKTMILLHRISQLLFNNHNLKAEKIRVITPSKNFNLKVHDLAHELELDRVPLLPLHEYYIELLDRYGLVKAQFSKVKFADERNLNPFLMTEIYSEKTRKILEHRYHEWLENIIRTFQPQILEEIAAKFDYRLSPKSGKKYGLSIIESYLIDISNLNVKYKSIQKKIDIAKENLIVKQNALSEYVLKNEPSTMPLTLFQAANEYLEMLHQYESAKMQYEIHKQETTDQIGYLENQRQILESQLAGLNVFQFVARRDINERISNITNEIERLTGSSYFWDIESVPSVIKLKDQVQKVEQALQAISNTTKIKSESDAHKLKLHEMDYYAKRNGFENEKAIRNADLEILEKQLILVEAQQLRLDQTTHLQSLVNFKVPQTEDVIKAVLVPYRATIFDKFGSDTSAREVYKFDLFYRLIICYAYFGPLSYFKQDTLINIDEGQDHAPAEYHLLNNILPEANLNIYGDVNQLIWTEWGTKDWRDLQMLKCRLININNNYRNSIQITEFSNLISEINTRPVGISSNSVEIINQEKVKKHLENLTPTSDYSSVIIVKNKEIYRKLKNQGIIPAERCRFIDAFDEEIQDSSDLIDVYTVAMSKGLEFHSVSVFTDSMTKQELYVAMTRAMVKLNYIMSPGAPDPENMLNETPSRPTEPIPPATPTPPVPPKQSSTHPKQPVTPLPPISPKPPATPPKQIPERDIAKLLVENGFKIVDKRDSDGALWIYYKKNMTDLLNKLLAGKYVAHYKEEGGKATDHYPAWWIK